MSQAQKENNPKKVVVGNCEPSSTKGFLAQRRPGGAILSAQRNNTETPKSVTVEMKGRPLENPKKAASKGVLAGNREPTATSRCQVKRSESVLVGQAKDTPKPVLVSRKAPTKIVSAGNREPAASNRFQAQRSVSAMVLSGQSKDAKTPKSAPMPQNAAPKSVLAGSRKPTATSRCQVQRSVSATVLSGHTKNAETPKCVLKPKSVFIERRGNTPTCRLGTSGQQIKDAETPKRLPILKKAISQRVLAGSRESMAAIRYQAQRSASALILSAQAKDTETPKSVQMSENAAPECVTIDSRASTSNSGLQAPRNASAVVIPGHPNGAETPKSVLTSKKIRSFKNAETPNRMKRRSKDMRCKKPTFKTRSARPITLSEALHVKDYIPRTLLQYPSSKPGTSSSMLPNKAMSLEVEKLQASRPVSTSHLKTAVFMKNQLVRISSLGSDVAVSNSHADLSGTIVLPGRPLLTQFLADSERYRYEQEERLAGQRISTFILVNSWRQRGAEVKRLQEKNDQLNNVRKITKTDLQMLRSLFHVEQNRAEDLQRLLDSEKMIREKLTASLTGLKVEKAVLEEQLIMKEEMIATLNDQETQLKLELKTAREQETKLRRDLEAKVLECNELREQKDEAYAAEVAELKMERNLMRSLMQDKNEALKKARLEIMVLKNTVAEQEQKEQKHKQPEVEPNIVITAQRAQLEAMHQNNNVEHHIDSDGDQWMRRKSIALRFVQLAMLFLIPEKADIPFEQILHGGKWLAHQLQFY